jgi:hypothetical protein
MLHAFLGDGCPNSFSQVMVPVLTSHHSDVQTPFRVGVKGDGGMVDERAPGSLAVMQFYGTKTVGKKPSCAILKIS